jgi:2-polyprenyl-3-methyl-5-hydroxy-6-metoxy-1,4-benzoquinol methylase
MTMHATEVAAGQRFEFGANWGSFLELLDDGRIHAAEESIRDLLEAPSLHGKRFLDIGCGSGLFSLAAARLGAQVHSVDFDPESVECARRLREKYGPRHTEWRVDEGSVLDGPYLQDLGVFDVVYSWGVLHHTGRMWDGLATAADRVAPGGALAIALYNDQGWRSTAWRRVKKLYCSGRVGRVAVCALFIPYLAVRSVLASLVTYGNPISYFKRYGRGMSVYHDWLDWLGGYPFEVAQPGAVVKFMRDRGFTLVHLKTVSGVGCNEYVFRRP